MDKLEQICKDAIMHGKRIEEFTNNHFGKFVVTGLQRGEDNTTLRRIGKVVQVRIGADEHGDDQVFLRHSDGVIWIHEDQCFYEINENGQKEIATFYGEFNNLDPAGEAYSVNGKKIKIGFLLNKCDK